MIRYWTNAAFRSARIGAVFSVLASSSLLWGADLKVDHVTVAGPDLAAMQRMFAEAGIPTEFGGKHSNGMTEMALSSFPDGSYLELIAPQAGADASPHYWGRFMAEQAGPCAWAVIAADIPSEAARLETAGVFVRAQSGGRSRPDGVALRWTTANVGPGPQGSYYPFLISDETKRELRAYPSGRPTMAAITGVRYVVVAVNDLTGAIAKYRKAFDLGEPQQQEDSSLGARLAWFPGTPVILAAPAGEGTWLADRLKRFGEIPCVIVFGSPNPWPTGGAGEAKWFSSNLTWLDSGRLGGMRLAVSRE
jgi:hypothetical protein